MNGWDGMVIIGHRSSKSTFGDNIHDLSFILLFYYSVIILSD